MSKIVFLSFFFFLHNHMFWSINQAFFMGGGRVGGGGSPYISPTHEVSTCIDTNLIVHSPHPHFIFFYPPCPHQPLLVPFQSNSIHRSTTVFFGHLPTSLVQLNTSAFLVRKPQMRRLSEFSGAKVGPGSKAAWKHMLMNSPRELVSTLSVEMEKQLLLLSALSLRLGIGKRE